LPVIRAVVEIDPEIANYYRSLIPKHITFKKPLHPAHISVVRKAIPENMEFWGKYEGEIITFEYDPYICFSEKYCWLRCYSTRLEDIREELGLPRHSPVTRPPDETPCFHTTIANFKMEN
jgi:hypothetical protein